MNVGIVHHAPIHREIWKALDPGAKIVLLANGQVTLDDDGRPCVTDEVLATTIRDIETALELR